MIFSRKLNGSQIISIENPQIFLFSKAFLHLDLLLCSRITLPQWPTLPSLTLTWIKVRVDDFFHGIPGILPRNPGKVVDLFCLAVFVEGN